ncbi:Mut7-C RNAse domain-containing protein [Herbiconiux sp. SYSU D00978]|uniref:Mut7-C RNAse domain-containing protein n=1 Tax=Herbiconiux sp. SYSU D00978 TaxID=2812562 RepID=UPI001A97188F|nr:Mut7-C RNAse domain-containing protein [Herbiconiux sp. SYSU D00978]
MPRVAVEVAEELRFLLPRRHRTGAIELDVPSTETVGHVVQSDLGIPLCEAEPLLDGGPVDPRARLDRDARLTVRERPRPQPLRAGFLLDVHLGALARRLRLLGLDAAYSPDADDPELAARSGAEQRVLLTRDRALLFRGALADGALVRADGVDDQLAEVLDRFAPPLAPWTRCLRCGGPLAGASAAEVAPLLEPGTRRTYTEFSRCERCWRVYWRGAHGRRLEAIVDRAERRMTR